MDAVNCVVALRLLYLAMIVRYKRDDVSTECRKIALIDTHRQTDRQTDTQTDRQTHRQVYRQIERKDRHTDQQSGRTDRPTDRQTDIQANRTPTVFARMQSMAIGLTGSLSQSVCRRYSSVSMSRTRGQSHAHAV